MSIMAKHARIFWAEPSDEEVRRRNHAVIAIRTWMSEIAPSTHAVEVAASLADAVASGSLSEEIVAVVERAIIDAGSDAFVRDGKELEIIVCALVASLDLIKERPVAADGWTATDAMAAGLWSALSFQSPVEKEGVEILRQEVLNASRDRVMEVAEATRSRTEVPEVGALIIPESAPTGSRANAAFKKATEPLVKALRDNAELDREEIDFLWWVLSDWSDFLDKPLSDLNTIARAVISGIDGGSKLKKLPASGHLQVVLRAVPLGQEATLAQVVVELSNYSNVLTSAFASTWISNATSVFPLLTALAGGNTLTTGADVSRPNREWGARALLEAGIFQINARKASRQ